MRVRAFTTVAICLCGYTWSNALRVAAHANSASSWTARVHVGGHPSFVVALGDRSEMMSLGSMKAHGV